jgi:hypothetical protein
VLKKKDKGTRFKGWRHTTLFSVLTLVAYLEQTLIDLITLFILNSSLAFTTFFRVVQCGKTVKKMAVPGKENSHDFLRNLNCFIT